MNEQQIQTSAFSAEISHEPRKMWKNGTTIMVAADDVTKLQADNWLLYSPEEMPQLLQEVQAACSELGRNAGLFVDALADGHLDTTDKAALATMNGCLSELLSKLGQLVAIANQAYPIKASGTIVSLTDMQGNIHIVPANQASAYADAFAKGLAAPTHVVVEHISDTQQVQLDKHLVNGELIEEPHMSPMRTTIFEFDLPKYESEGWVKV